MTNLQCSVKSCTSNENHCCCLDSIKVDGLNATNSSETCCKSYHERGSFVSNFIPVGAPEPATEVSCDVANCNYNRAKMCTKSDIEIDSMGTSPRGMSECSSFLIAQY